MISFNTSLIWPHKRCVVKLVFWTQNLHVLTKEMLSNFFSTFKCLYYSILQNILKRVIHFILAKMNHFWNIIEERCYHIHTIMYLKVSIKNIWANTKIDYYFKNCQVFIKKNDYLRTNKRGCSLVDTNKYGHIRILPVWRQIFDKQVYTNNVS